MDTSEKYIKMCEKAGEIQKQWLSKKAGDWHVLEGFNARIIGGSENMIIGNDFYNWDRDSIWLPRQDQLQGMMKDSKPLISEEKFHEWFREIGASWTASWEQLWLGFVMHEKYGKVWDDSKEEWQLAEN